MSLLTLYALCATAGAVLLATSIFFGGEHGHADAGHDADVHVDTDTEAPTDLAGHVEAAAEALTEAAGNQLEAHGVHGFEWSVVPFGSLRFWTFLLECFGLTGTLLSLAGVPSGTTLALSLTMGSGLGWAAFQFFRWLAHEQVSGTTELQQFQETEARVLLRIPVGGVGKIAIEQAAGRVELIARTHDDREIPRGAQVLVIGVKGGEAEVTVLKAAESDAVRVPAARTVDEG